MKRLSRLIYRFGPAFLGKRFMKRQDERGLMNEGVLCNSLSLRKRTRLDSNQRPTA